MDEQHPPYAYQTSGHPQNPVQSQNLYQVSSSFSLPPSRRFEEPQNRFFKQSIQFSAMPMPPGYPQSCNPSPVAPLSYGPSSDFDPSAPPAPQLYHGFPYQPGQYENLQADSYYQSCVPNFYQQQNPFPMHPSELHPSQANLECYQSQGMQNVPTDYSLHSHPSLHPQASFHSSLYSHPSLQSQSSMDPSLHSHFSGSVEPRPRNSVDPPIPQNFSDTGFTPAMPSPSTSYKRGLVIGCNYESNDSMGSLKSCVNDALAMKYTLVDGFGYKDDDVRVLVDTPNLDKNFLRPTRLNIIKHIKCGHGTQSMNYDGDEICNQCLMPCDHAQSGVLVDDDINRMLIHPLPEGCVLHCLVDCCHSGSIMDLQFEANHTNWTSKGPTREYKGTNGGHVFQFAACRDNERAFEQRDNGEYSCGAATMAFISAISQKDMTITYGGVLKYMQDAVNEYAKNANGGNSTFWRFCKHKLKQVIGRLYQKPQLSSNTDSVPLDCEIDL